MTRRHRRERRKRHRSRPPLIRTAALAACSLLLAGCAVPADPDGTLDRVTGGILEVGMAVEPGLVEVAGDRPEGSLVDLVEEFAAEIDATPVWTVASEESLVGLLESERIDLAVGGFTDTTPWSDRVGISRGYDGILGADGRKIVLLVPMGENAFLARLEAFLDEEVGS